MSQALLFCLKGRRGSSAHGRQLWWITAGMMVVLMSGMTALMKASDAPGETVLSLTLRDCVERALARNLEIQLERTRPAIAAWGVEREEAAFDPSWVGRASFEDISDPLDPERSASLGLNSIDTERLRARAGLEGRAPTGLEYALTGFDTRTQGTLAPDSVHVGMASLTLRQPLLKNFGTGPNLTRVRMARVGQSVAREQLMRQIIETVATVHVRYHDLSHAIEQRRAAQEDLDRARALLADNKRRVELGVLSPLEVTQAEAGAAEREEAVIVAERTVAEMELALKRLITDDITGLRGVRFELLDPPRVERLVLDGEASIRAALEHRPDYRQKQAELERRRMWSAFNRNQLLPQVDLEGSYGFNARAGNFGNFADNVASGDNPVWSVGVVVTIPLGNRAARANYNAARLEVEQAEIELKKMEQDIMVEVGIAVGRVRSNLKRVEATRVASRLAVESLKAEESKLAAGRSTSFQVLQAQAQLASAQSAEIRARADYAQSVVTLGRIEGTLLDRLDIRVEDAPVP